MKGLLSRYLKTVLTHFHSSSNVCEMRLCFYYFFGPLSSFHEVFFFIWLLYLENIIVVRLAKHENPRLELFLCCRHFLESCFCLRHQCRIWLFWGLRKRNAKLFVGFLIDALKSNKTSRLFHIELPSPSKVETFNRCVCVLCQMRNKNLFFTFFSAEIRRNSQTEITLASRL